MQDVRPPTGGFSISEAKQRAEELIVFCDGLEAGRALHSYAARARNVARDVLELVELLEAERSARVALQQRCETQQEILGKRAYEATAAELWG